MACRHSGDRGEASEFVLNQLCNGRAKLDHLDLHPAPFHLRLSLFQGLFFAEFDVFPELLAKNVNAVLKLFVCLSFANEVGELATETVVVLTVLVNSSLLVTLTTKVVDELVLSFV